MPRPPGPALAAADAFAGRLERLAAGHWRPGQPLALAVSGGADSLALLALAARALPSDSLVALTVDHGWRAAAAAEARQVAQIADGVGVRHRTLKADDPPPEANRQAAARGLRYRLLARACADQGVAVCATAHHADDQAETLLLRLARGSGLAGLAGVRPAARIEGLLVVRPLLGVPRPALAALVNDEGWPVVDDPSNLDPAFDRARIRAAMAALSLPVMRLAAAAAQLAQAAEALDWAEAREWAARARPHGPGLAVELDGLPAELGRRLLARALVVVGGGPVRGRQAAALLRLEPGGRATLAGCVVERNAAERWTISPEPRRR